METRVQTLCMEWGGFWDMYTSTYRLCLLNAVLSGPRSTLGLTSLALLTFSDVQMFGEWARMSKVLKARLFHLLKSLMTFTDSFSWPASHLSLFRNCSFHDVWCLLSVWNGSGLAKQSLPYRSTDSSHNPMSVWGSVHKQNCISISVMSRVQLYKQTMDISFFNPQANPPCLLSTVQYISSFYANCLSGEESYWWMQFTAAVEFIKTIDDRK